MTDKWIDWNGGECPVAVYVDVEIELRKGVKDVSCAGDWNWLHDNSDADIIRYRIADEEWNGEGVPPVGTVCDIECDLTMYQECTILYSSRVNVVFSYEAHCTVEIANSVAKCEFYKIKKTE